MRFPECLRLPDCVVTPFAIQPGQVLTPENCAVGLRVDGAFGTWVGTWRPAERRVRHLPAPEGWLAGAGVWTPEGVLRLPYATRATPCGVSHLTAAAARGNAGAAEPGRTGGEAEWGRPGGEAEWGRTGGVPEPGRTGGAASARPAAPCEPRPPAPPGSEAPAPSATWAPAPSVARSAGSAPTRPVPLQQAPLGRLVTN